MVMALIHSMVALAMTSTKKNVALDTKVNGTGDKSVNDVFKLLPSWVDAI